MTIWIGWIGMGLMVMMVGLGIYGVLVLSRFLRR